MKELRDFDIDIFRLKSGSYDLELEVKEEFFKFFDYGLMETGALKATISMQKSETLINMIVHLKGSVAIVCDRSLEVFDYPVDTENKILFKFGDKDEEVSDEILIIDRNTQKLNLAQHLYDFISLAIPIKKLHPRFQEEDEDPDVEGILVYTSHADEEGDKIEDQEDIDPRWSILKNLNKNK